MTPRPATLGIFYAAAGCALLSGCALGPDFAPPDPPLPGSSFERNGASRADAVLVPPDPQWWRAFCDPLLTRLEKRVAQDNLDVQTATIRLAESRFERNVAAAAQFPGVNATGTYRRELYSANGIASLLGALIPGNQSNGVNIPPISDYTVGLDASWELDLWGHVRRQVESAEAQAQQSEEMRRDALVSTEAELARDYIQLRGVQTQIKIAEANLKVSQEIQRVAEERQAKGIRTGYEAQTSAAQTESVRAQIPALASDESRYANAIGFLLGEPPETLKGELAAARRVPLAPPRTPVGVPSELARRRPDIRAAEAQLHSATAEIGVAVASFYPTVKLNGTIGFDALNLKKLFYGNSLQYNAGPSVSLPIFDAGRLKGTLELRKAQQQEAAVAYQKTVLQAWREVVDALVAHREELQRRARLKAQLDHARAALGIAKDRYKQGVGDFLTVLDAERSMLQAAQQYETSTTNVSLDLVQLYKALGGGWEEIYPEAPPPEAELISAL